MADAKLSRKENVRGDFFVDSTCIDCGTCYWVAGETFRRSGDKSAVHCQPTTPSGRTLAHRALYSCPTHSIGVRIREPLAREVLDDCPFLVRDNVYHTGFHAEHSFGAASYFIKRERGNVLIDSPRFVKRLAARFAAMGGLAWQLLTHKDDLADTDKYQEVFQGKRFIHADDKTAKSSHYEEFFTGQEDIILDDEWTVIPVPGHTKGSCCFLYRNTFLFTGDHLAYSPTLGHLVFFKRACWYDLSVQKKSLERLLDYRFECVLPGHGTPFQGSPQEVRRSLAKCLAWGRA